MKPSRYTIEQLVKYALGIKEPRKKRVKRPILGFLKYINAVSSEVEHTPKYIIYYVYYKWSARRHKAPVTSYMLSLYLKREGYKQKQPKPKGYRAYHILSDSFKLSEKELIEARKLQDKLTGNIYEKKEV